MMFHVKPGDIEMFAGDMTGLADQAQQAKIYVEANVKGPATTGFLLQLVAPGVERMRAQVLRNVEALHQLSGRCAQELERTAALYRSTEAKIAASMDAVYPNKAPQQP